MMAVRWLSALTAVLVLVQAVLIGQALYVNGMSTLALHGWLGSGSFLVAVVLTGMAFLSYRRGEVSSSAIALGALIVVLMVAQIGLGYSGRQGGWPAALHIPNGVLIAGLLSMLGTMSFTPAKASQVRA